MIGSIFSTSQNATVISFTGGPHDGEKGLYDHDRYQSIQFVIGRSTHVYKRNGPSSYIYNHEHKWGES